MQFRCFNRGDRPIVSDRFKDMACSGGSGAATADLQGLSWWRWWLKVLGVILELRFWCPGYISTVLEVICEVPGEGGREVKSIGVHGVGIVRSMASW